MSFNWKDSGRTSIGLIAQDVEKIFPEIVSTDEAGIKSVDYAKLIAPLIEAIKEQQSQIEELKLEIEELKLKIRQSNWQGKFLWKKQKTIKNYSLQPDAF